MTDPYYNLIVNVYDVSDPTNIVCVSTLGGGNARGVHARGTTLYLMAAFIDEQPELLTLDATDCFPVTGVGDTPTSTPALRVAPSVLRSGPARITLRTESARRPKPLKIVDVAGRLVGRVPLEFAGEGVWTGRWEPEVGGGVSSGKYWVVGENTAAVVTVLH